MESSFMGQPLLEIVPVNMRLLFLWINVKTCWFIVYYTRVSKHKLCIFLTTESPNKTHHWWSPPVVVGRPCVQRTEWPSIFRASLCQHRLFSPRIIVHFYSGCCLLICIVSKKLNVMFLFRPICWCAIILVSNDFCLGCLLYILFLIEAYHLSKSVE